MKAVGRTPFVQVLGICLAAGLWVLPACGGGGKATEEPPAAEETAAAAEVAEEEVSEEAE